MPNISEKGKRMPASPIRKLVPFAEEAKKKGRVVYHLNIGQPDIRTPEVAMEAIRNLKMEVVEYSHSAGIESYRRKLAIYYQRLGLSIDYTQLLVTTGGSEAILFTLMSCLNPGDEVIAPEPLYANYIGFAVTAGVTVVPVTAHLYNNFALPPIADFEKLITPKTKAIIICNPNNPTGYLYSREEILKLRDLVKKHDLFLIVDEVYREFCYDGKEHFSALKLEGVDRNIIMVDSVSKRYSACGIRIGAIVTRNKEVLSAALKFAQARLSPPTFGQIAAEAAIDTPSVYFDEVYKEYIGRRNYMVGALNKMEGVKCPLPMGAFYTVVHLPVDDADVFAQWLLSDFVFENQTVMIAPGSGFYVTPGLGRQEARIAYVLKIDDLKMAMQCLDRALKVYPGRIV
jgi:aspartate aminotransferase